MVARGYIEFYRLCTVNKHVHTSCILAVVVESVNAEGYCSVNGYGDVVAFPFDIVEWAFYAVVCAGIVTVGIHRVGCGIYGAVNVLLCEVELLQVACHMIYCVLNDVEIVKTAIISCRSLGNVYISL